MANQSEKQIARQRKKITVAAAYKEVFSSTLGQKVLNDMMSAHFMFQTSMHSDQSQAAYNEGQRAVILRIMSIMKMDNAARMKALDLAEKQSADVGHV